MAAELLRAKLISTTKFLSILEVKFYSEFEQSLRHLEDFLTKIGIQNELDHEKESLYCQLVKLFKVIEK